MTLKDLIDRYRLLARDQANPPLASNADVTAWLNEAQEQACIRGRLLVAESDPTMCRVTLTPGQAAYTLDAGFYELIDLRIQPATGDARPVTLQSREWLDAEIPRWRDYPYPARYAIQTDTGLRIVGQIATGDVLWVEAYRLPEDGMTEDTDKPEIHAAHHPHLVQWVLYRAFSVPDSELFDEDRAARAEEAFTQYFGPMPDVDLRRATRVDVVHHTVAILP